LKLSKQGETVYVVDGRRKTPLRDFVGRLDALSDFLVGVGPFGRLGEFFGYPRDTRILYFLENADDRKKVIELVQAGIMPIYQQRRQLFAGGGTVDMFWENREVKETTRLLAGAVQFFPNQATEQIVVTHMSVRPKWRRNRLNWIMVDAIAERYPNFEIEFDSPTEMGSKFMHARER
jgi:hypothetical protein